MRKGEIEGRLDPNYVYLSKVLKEKFKNSNYEFINFGKCINYIQYGISALANTEQKGVPIIRMGNLRGDEWDFSNLKHIELSEKDLEIYKVLNGDLLFNRTNSKELVGKSGVFREEGDWVFASYLIRVRVDENLLLPDFASFFLGSTIGRMQIDCLSRQIIGMTNINAEEIKLIKIPVPPVEIQEQIIEKFESAYNVKRAKETEAKKLLDSIEAYLLEHLGIETSATTEKKKTFFVHYSQISGSRFDAPAYKTAFDYSSSKFKVENLSKIAFINPKVSFEKLDEESEISFVPMEVINEHTGTIEELRSKKVKDSKGFTRFQENDLIWAKITPCMQNGKSAIARNLKQGFACGSTEFYVIRPRTNDVLVDFIYLLLRNKRVLENAQNFFGGSAGQQRVSIDFLKNFKIPLPPLEVQEEIAAHIQSIRQQAKDLEREAKAEVERAKAEVEAMILGAAK